MAEKPGFRQSEDRSADASAASKRIEEQHVQLRDLIAEIGRTLENSSDNDERICFQLATLLKKLESHFLDEEEEGFFDQIEQHAPRLSSETKQLKEEHQLFLNQVGKLIATAESCERTVLWWQGLKTDFHEFSKALMHHESMENQLLQRAYSEDIGTRD